MAFWKVFCIFLACWAAVLSKLGTQNWRENVFALTSRLHSIRHVISLDSSTEAQDEYLLEMRRSCAGSHKLQQPLQEALGLRVVANASVSTMSIPPLDDNLDSHKVMIRVFQPDKANAQALKESKTPSHQQMKDLAKLLPRSEQEMGLRPAILFMHGGGFCICGNGSHDGLLHRLAQLYNTVVVAVEYRKAPEHTWPDAPEDVQAALRFLSGVGGARLGVSAQAIFVAGDSAGGNLAAVAALWARDGEVDQFGRPVSDSSPLEHPVLGQMLLYPFTNYLSAAPGSGHEVGSVKEHGTNTPWVPWDGKFLTAKTMQVFTHAYLRDTVAAFGAQPQLRAHPFHSPLHASTHENLPPALIVLAETDVLRDDGLQYADKLLKAGVHTQVLDVPGTQHGFLNARILFDRETEQVITAMGEFMRSMLWAAFSSKGGAGLVQGSALAPAHKDCSSVCALHCAGPATDTTEEERSPAEGGMLSPDERKLRERTRDVPPGVRVDSEGMLLHDVDLAAGEAWPGDEYYVGDTAEAAQVAREYAKLAQKVDGDLT